MSEPLVQFEDVDFAYDSGRPVLRGCSLRLEAGQKLALLGGNGAGKSTLLHLAVGLLRPTAGRIAVLGRSRQREGDFHEVRRRVGLLFQDSDDQLFCPTVAEDVAFGPLNLGKTRDEARTIVARTLDALGLDGYQQRITYRLSGGEKRLVALATVLAMEPEVLLLDEPAAGLDDAARQRLCGILVRLPQAMILVSHDRPFWEELATSVAKLADCRLELLDRKSPVGSDGEG
jgi:cobalt/nickel transport system ATP-binding protein